MNKQSAVGLDLTEMNNRYFLDALSVMCRLMWLCLCGVFFLIQEVCGEGTLAQSNDPAAGLPQTPAMPSRDIDEHSGEDEVGYTDRGAEVFDDKSEQESTKEVPTPIVREIEILYVGPKSVNKNVILSNMRTTVGQPYTVAGVDEDIRNLYATGLFTNLRISDEPYKDGVKVIVVVQPKPLIKDIIITGYKAINEARLRKEIKSKVGAPLDERQVATDADKIKELYLDRGYSQVQVTYKTDVNEEFGRATVTFNISESTKAYVTKIKFEGNASIKDKELKKQMKTKEKNWLWFINKSGRYKDDQINEDLRAIRDYYQGKGFIDMSITDFQTLTVKENEMHLLITINEGKQYRVGTIEYRGNEIYSTEQIKAKTKMIENEIYSPQALQADIEAIQDLYGQKGYIDVDIFPERSANYEAATVDIVYNISEGVQSTVDRIIIQGNNRTKDKVIRRELAIAPGDIYDSTSVKASKARLENLGYFEKVDIAPQETQVPNRKNILITVQEKRTGSISFGAGFSSVDSLVGFIELSQGNFDIGKWPSFTGAGQKFRTRIQYGLKRRDFLLSFTEPWFLDQRLAFGFDLFARESSYLSTLYNERRVGGAIRVARALNDYWTASLRYQLENIEMFDFSTSASPELLRERGGRSKSSLTAMLSYDTRDNVFLTRKGERIDFTAEIAGGPVLMGQTNIYRFQIDAQKFWSLPYDLILSFNLSTGVVNRYDDSEFVPIYDRFFIGGSRSIRGFDNRDVGPRDSLNEPIGGRTFGFVNLELTVPIIDRVRGAVFIDAGFVDPRFAHYGDMFDLFNASVGFGIRLNLPIGPLRFDFGIPIKSDEYNDSDGKFHFDVGYQF
ncbi:MAG: outer membrane protein assembly factor BamA [Methylacidiphilales bacterium]|nr:outer membrane protein assembly factor BamA [Candidatus Methylacidiphilales bacterium]